MELKIKFLKWSAGVPVAMLRKETAAKIGVRAQDRITIKRKNHAIFTSILDTVESGLIKPDEIGVSFEISNPLNLKQGQKVEIHFSPVPKSLELIKKKLNNIALSDSEIKEIITDVVDNSLSEAEIALFISAMYRFGMSFRETVSLIKAMLESGEKISFKEDFVVDKHSIGGIAGNRTTPLVVSICAAGGLIIPKTSSRAITSAAGTADVIETIAKVVFSMNELKKIIKKTNGCMVWGGSLGMAPADDKIIQVERGLKIDPESQLLASIMSKKLAMGAKYILIDIPYGDSAKVSKKKALHLKKEFERLGRYFKKKLKVVLTDGSQPIGNGIGPILELMDIVNILSQKDGPRDLENKSLFLSGQIFELCGKAKKGGGIEIAKEILYSGKAFKKFKQIISAQHGSLKKLKISPIHQVIRSTQKGKISSIDNKKINSLARIAGCPADKSAGLYLHVHKNYSVQKNVPLMTIYAESKSRLKEAVKFYFISKPIIIR